MLYMGHAHLASDAWYLCVLPSDGEADIGTGVPRVGELGIVGSVAVTQRFMTNAVLTMEGGECPCCSGLGTASLLICLILCVCFCHIVGAVLGCSNVGSLPEGAQREGTFQ